MNEFPIYTVEELIKHGVLYKPLDGNHGGIHPKGSDFVESGIPFIMASDMAGGGIDTEGCKFITEEQASTLRKGFAVAGDVLLSHKATIGRTAIVPTLQTDYVMLTPQVTYYRVKDSNSLNNRYLKFYFDSAPFQNLFNQWAGGGSTRAYLGITGQLKLPIIVPDIKTQQFIADVLGTIDDKIELNRQMNETLEAMAQALFKSWFVDFDPVIDNALAADNEIPEPLQARAAARQALGDQRKPLPPETQSQFPSSFVFTDEMGWIPEGWEITELKSFGEIVCGKTPTKAKPEYFGNDLPFIKIPDMHSSMFVTTPTEYLSELGAESQAKKELPRGSVCVSCIATVGKVVITTEPSHTNQQINSIVPNDSFFTGYLYFSMLAKNKLFHDLASGGSATLNMNTSTFANVLMLKPSSALLKQFAESVSDSLAKVELNMREAETLGSLRDVLLPKLLSGELRVNDAELQLVEAL